MPRPRGTPLLTVVRDWGRSKRKAVATGLLAHLFYVWTAAIDWVRSRGFGAAFLTGVLSGVLSSLVAAAIWSWWVYRLPQSDFWAEVVVTAHVGALSQNFVPPAGPLRITAQMGPLVLPLELVKQPDGISAA